MDLTAALKWLEAAVITTVGHALREPEIVILRGTWRGLTYEQMADGSDYSTNYLMRDVAPKLWKQLSIVFRQSVGKTNFRVALEAYVAANAAIDPDLAAYGLTGMSELRLENEHTRDAARLDRGDRIDGLEPSLDWHPAVISEGAYGTSQSLVSAAGSSTAFSNQPLSVASSLMLRTMYGYDDELAQVIEWFGLAGREVQNPRQAIGAKADGLTEPPISEAPQSPQLLGIWGLHGIGKTLLVEQWVAQVEDRFDAVIWRSLQDQPSLDDLSASILTHLGFLPQAGQAVAQLLALMTKKSLLLILEGAEALLKPNCLAGDYQPSCRPYHNFFQSVVGLQSCLVLTGIEGPADWVRQGSFGQQLPVRSLRLTHLDEASASELLTAEAVGSPEHWPELIARYQGHPLALKAAARVIREIFNGRVDEFLQQNPVLFNDIVRLLEPSFERLCEAEVDILYWLASQENPLSLVALQQSLPWTLSSAELISAVDSLKQRSFLTLEADDGAESDPPLFVLPALVKAYVIHRLVGQFGTNDSSGNPQKLVEVSSSQPILDQPIINLNPSKVLPVQLHSWFQSQFSADWHPLSHLLSSVSDPAPRLRNIYHLREAAFVKRCKFLTLGEMKLGSAAHSTLEVVLLVALHQEQAAVYRVFVQIQPDKEIAVLPASLSLNLLNEDRAVLATVIAAQGDSFIQLPYLQGTISDAFSIQITLGDLEQTEIFMI